MDITKDKQDVFHLFNFEFNPYADDLEKIGMDFVFKDDDNEKKILHIKFDKSKPDGIGLRKETIDKKNHNEQEFYPKDDYLWYYWYHQIHGQCVFHALRNILQEEGQDLTEPKFVQFSHDVLQKYDIKDSDICGVCMDKKFNIKVINRIKQHNEKMMQQNKACTVHYECITHAYLAWPHTEKVTLLLRNDLVLQKDTTNCIKLNDKYLDCVKAEFDKLFEWASSNVEPIAILMKVPKHLRAFRRLPYLNPGMSHWYNLDSNADGGPELLGNKEEMWNNIKQIIGENNFDVFKVWGYTLVAVFEKGQTAPTQGISLWSLANSCVWGKSPAVDIKEENILYDYWDDNDNEEKVVKERLSSHMFEYDMGENDQLYRKYDNVYHRNNYFNIFVIILSIICMCLICFEWSALCAVIGGFIVYIGSFIIHKEKYKNEETTYDDNI